MGVIIIKLYIFLNLNIYKYLMYGGLKIILLPFSFQIFNIFFHFTIYRINRFIG